MTFKRVTSAVAGDATHFGGLDVNKYSDYLGGTDIGGSETVDIATLTAFRDSKFTLRNPANTFSYVFVPSAIAANRNVTLPLLTGNDTLVGEAFAQTLTNKSISGASNTLSNVADSSLLQITDKAKLPSAAVYTDQTNTYGDFSSIFRATRVKIRNPANTFSYTITGSAIAADRAVTLPVLTGDDTVAFEAFSQTLTNKTFNTTDNSLTATSQATGDVLTNNGSKFVRLARGTALQVLRVNSGGTDIGWQTLDSERVGKSTAASGASVYTIAHGLGSNPTYAFVDCSSHTTARTFTTDSTNITVTFASTISSGTVTIYWRVVA